MEKVFSTAPSHWACYLINGDDDNMSAEDLRQCHAWLNWIGADCTPVDCEDAGFMRGHDAAPFGVLAADCQTYTFLV